MALTAGMLGALSGLGLGSFDAVGLAAMPVLLSQPRGVRRAYTFLAGSVVAMMGLGLALASGLGRPLLDFTRAHPWLDPAFEVFSGIVLILVGGWLIWHAWRQARSGQVARLAGDSLVRRLELPLVALFAFGVVLVLLQSVIDVAYLVAMVEMEAAALTWLETTVAIGVYTFAALVLQWAVVLVYQFADEERRVLVLERFADWLDKHGEWVAGVLTILLGVVLLVVSGQELLLILQRGAT